MSNLVFEEDPAKRPGFKHDLLGDGTTEYRSWAEWHEIMMRLEQELSKRLRVYPGPSTEDTTPPDGGQSSAGHGDVVLQRMAA